MPKGRVFDPRSCLLGTAAVPDEEIDDAPAIGEAPRRRHHDDSSPRMREDVERSGGPVGAEKMDGKPHEIPAIERIR